MVQCAERIWIHKQVGRLSLNYGHIEAFFFSFSNLKTVFNRNDTKEDVFVHQVRKRACSSLS